MRWASPGAARRRRRASPGRRTGRTRRPAPGARWPRSGSGGDLAGAPSRLGARAGRGCTVPGSIASEAVNALSDRLSQDPFSATRCTACSPTSRRSARRRKFSKPSMSWSRAQRRGRFIAIVGGESGRSPMSRRRSQHSSTGRKPTRGRSRRSKRSTISSPLATGTFQRSKTRRSSRHDGNRPAVEARAGRFLPTRMRGVAVGERPCPRPVAGAAPASARSTQATERWSSSTRAETTRRRHWPALAAELSAQEAGRRGDSRIALLAPMRRGGAPDACVVATLAGARAHALRRLPAGGASARATTSTRCARRFSASFEQVCHRLVTLRRPGAEGIALRLMRADAAGYVTKRFPLPRLPLPRYGDACPLWAVYSASRRRARWCASSRSSRRRPLPVRRPRGRQAAPGVRDAAAPDVGHARVRRAACRPDWSMATGLDLSSAAPARPGRPRACRLCPRAECAYREEDPIVDAGRGATRADTPVPATARPRSRQRAPTDRRQRAHAHVLIAEDEPHR